VKTARFFLKNAIGFFGHGAPWEWRVEKARMDIIPDHFVAAGKIPGQRPAVSAQRGVGFGVGWNRHAIDSDSNWHSGGPFSGVTILCRAICTRPSVSTAIVD
jgi:hypothetical protein